MKKWTCEVCGYVHRGEEPPEVCPKCGAPRSRFYRKERGSTGWNTLSILAVIVTLIILLLTFMSCSGSARIDNSPVKTLNVERYMGEWFEIARFDHAFERGMEQCRTSYVLLNDGKVQITNRGVKKGKWRTAEGKAKTTETPGLLRVSFFWPFYSDYRVLMVADDYSYALVGSRSDSYLWILARSPRLGDEQRQKIIDEALRRGYRPERLIWVKQK